MTKAGNSPAPPPTWGGFLKQVKAGVAKAALAEGSGATGGYLVPQELATPLLADVAGRSIVRPFATVVPMGSQTVELPLPDAQTAVTAGYPPYFGGMYPRWTAEAGTRTQVEPAFRQVRLTACELSGTVYVSNPLLQDAPALDAFLRQLIAAAVAWMEDQAFLVGTLAGQPRGMLANSTAVTRSGANAFAAADAYGMVEKLLPSSWDTALWVVHPSVAVKLPQLTNWQPNEAGGGKAGPAGKLHGLPLYVSDKVNALGTAGDVLLVDPALYAVGDRSLEIAVSPDAAFTSNQTVFRVTRRVAGVPYLAGAVTLADGTKTANAYVSLTT